MRIHTILLANAPKSPSPSGTSIAREAIEGLG